MEPFEILYKLYNAYTTTFILHAFIISYFIPTLVMICHDAHKTKKCLLQGKITRNNFYVQFLWLYYIQQPFEEVFTEIHEIRTFLCLDLSIAWTDSV